jgi:lipooligosaccharide transport system permease protein
MLAAAAMQTGYFESAGGAARSVLPSGAYRAATPTPVGPTEIMGGHLLFIAFRVLTSSLAFVLAMMVFGVTSGWSALGTLAAATLTGLAFAAPGLAWAVGLRRNQNVTVVFRFVILPMYMFSGTFFAVAQMPHWLRPVVYLLPLYHGATLTRALSLGTATWGSAALHGGVLLALVVAGILAARVTYRRRLHA